MPEPDRPEVLDSLLEGVAGFHPFDAVKHPRGVHGRWAHTSAARSPRTTLSSGDATLRRNMDAADARRVIRPDAVIAKATERMSTHDALDALASGKVKDTLGHWTMPDGKLHIDRERLHVKILQEALKGHERQAKPTAVFTAGGSASGKTVLRHLRGDQKAVVIDPDEIRKLLPEYKRMTAQGGKAAEIAAGATHEEASALAKRLTRLARERGHNIVVDGTGDGGVGAFAKKIEAAKKAGYAVKVRYAHAPLGQALERNRARFEKEKRLVGEKEVIAKHKVVADTYLRDIRKLKGVEVTIYDRTTRGKLDARLHPQPPVISHQDAGGKLKVKNPERQREFEAKAR